MTDAKGQPKAVMVTAESAKTAWPWLRMSLERSRRAPDHPGVEEDETVRRQQPSFDRAISETI